MRDAGSMDDTYTAIIKAMTKNTTKSEYLAPIKICVENISEYGSDRNFWISEMQPY